MNEIFIKFAELILKLAPPKRFELLTPSFVAKYSNPLSYGGINF